MVDCTLKIIHGFISTYTSTFSLGLSSDIRWSSCGIFCCSPCTGPCLQRLCPEWAAHSEGSASVPATATAQQHSSYHISHNQHHQILSQLTEVGKGMTVLPQRQVLFRVHLVLFSTRDQGLTPSTLSPYRALLSTLLHLQRWAPLSTDSRAGHLHLTPALGITQHLCLPAPESELGTTQHLSLHALDSRLDTTQHLSLHALDSRLDTTQHLSLHALDSRLDTTQHLSLHALDSRLDTTRHLSLHALDSRLDTTQHLSLHALDSRLDTTQHLSLHALDSRLDTTRHLSLHALDSRLDTTQHLSLHALDSRLDTTRHLSLHAQDSRVGHHSAPFSAHTGLKSWTPLSTCLCMHRTQELGTTQHISLHVPNSKVGHHSAPLSACTGFRVGRHSAPFSACTRVKIWTPLSTFHHPVPKLGTTEHLSLPAQHSSWAVQWVETGFLMDKQLTFNAQSTMGVISGQAPFQVRKVCIYKLLRTGRVRLLPSCVHFSVPGTDLVKCEHFLLTFRGGGGGHYNKLFLSQSSSKK